MSSNEQGKNISKEESILTKETKSIFLYYNWEKSKNKSLEKKENDEKEKSLYAINKKFIEDWKIKIKYEDLKKEIAKNEKEKKEQKLENIINEFYKKEKGLDLKSMGEIKNIPLLKKFDESTKEENYVNPELNEEDVELLNKEVFESFKEFKFDVTIMVDCNLKEGEYILKNKSKQDDKKEKTKIIEGEKNKEDNETKTCEDLKENNKGNQTNNENKIEEDLKEKNKNLNTSQTEKNENEENLKKENEKENNEGEKKEEKKKLEEEKKEKKNGEETELKKEEKKYEEKKVEDKEKKKEEKEEEDKKEEEKKLEEKQLDQKKEEENKKEVKKEE